MSEKAKVVYKEVFSPYENELEAFLKAEAHFAKVLQDHGKIMLHPELEQTFLSLMKKKLAELRKKNKWVKAIVLSSPNMHAATEHGITRIEQEIYRTIKGLTSKQLLVGFPKDERLDITEQHAKEVEFKRIFPNWEIRPVYIDPETTEGLGCVTPKDVTMTTYVLVMYHGQHKWISEQFLRFWQRMAQWSGRHIVIDIWKQTSYLNKKIKDLKKAGFNIVREELGQLFSLVRIEFNRCEK